MYKLIFALILLIWASMGDAAYTISNHDISVYQQLWALHKAGKYTQAQQTQKQLKDKTLLGYVLFDRYFSKSYPTQKKEIQSWMEKYADLPIAIDMYALGQQKKVKNLKKPTGLFGAKTGACTHPQRTEPIDLIKKTNFTYLSGQKKKQAIKIMNRIVKHLQNGHTLSAKNLLNQKSTISLFSQTDIDKVRTALAFNYFLDGENKLALDTISKALKKSESDIPLALWIKGLILWKAQDFQQSADTFSKLAHTNIQSAVKARAGFWAARAYLHAGIFHEVVPHLQIAATQPRNFYGLLAMHALGQNIEQVWDTPVQPQDEMTDELSHPALNRFYALTQIDKKEWAEQELSKLYVEADDEIKGVLTLIAEQNGFTDSLQGLTGTLQGESTRYPMPNWCPMNNWQIDKALVFAFVRQESCFNHRAESKVGALGLMHLMPKTAQGLANSLSCPSVKQRLKEPAYNLALGQTYLKQLLKTSYIQNNILWTSVAYNAGPGNLLKWEKKMQYNNDPLLFLESIPSKETRSFSERILMNYWVYRSLTGQSLTSLEQMVKGNWPLYE